MAQPFLISFTPSSIVVIFIIRMFGRNCLIVSQSKFVTVFIKSFLDTSFRGCLNIYFSNFLFSLNNKLLPITFLIVPIQLSPFKPPASTVMVSPCWVPTVVVPSDLVTEKTSLSYVGVAVSSGFNLISFQMVITYNR